MPFRYDNAMSDSPNLQAIGSHQTAMLVFARSNGNRISRSDEVDGMSAGQRNKLIDALIRRGALRHVGDRTFELHPDAATWCDELEPAA